MKLQISSGRGPAECELAVAGFYKIIEREIPGITVISSYPGKRAGTFQSILLSQHQNKQLALNRLCNIMAEAIAAAEKQKEHLAWVEHDRIVRGNPIRTYEGMDWKVSV